MSEPIEHLVSLYFVVPGQPIGKGRPRFTGRIAYTPAKTRNAEAFIKMRALEAMDGRRPFEGPVMLSLDVAIEPPRSWSKKKLAAALSGDIQPTSKPDIDNILKLYADALNGITYTDDKQITFVTVRKKYSKFARVGVTVSYDDYIKQQPSVAA